MVSAKAKPKSLFLVSTWLKFLIEPKLRPKFLIYPKSGQNSLYSWKYLMIRPTISEIKQDFCWKLQFQLFTLLPLYLCIFAQAALQPTEVDIFHISMLSSSQGTIFFANILSELYTQKIRFFSWDLKTLSFIFRL